MSHVSVTLPQDYKQAPTLVEVHLVAVFDPFLGMGLTALGLTECLWMCVWEWTQMFSVISQ